jgi:hypothetical protein
MQQNLRLIVLGRAENIGDLARHAAAWLEDRREHAPQGFDPDGLFKLVALNRRRPGLYDDRCGAIGTARCKSQQ